jgi:DNA polymerase I-like protein with 3'-5' exonuclease and polymerase domains
LEESTTRDLALPERSHYVSPSFGEATDWLASLKGARWISFDIETFKPAHISCIAFSDSPDRAYCIPLMRGNRQSYWTPYEETSIWRMIQDVFNQPGTRYIAQNGLFDTWHLYRHGIRVPYMAQGFDTMYAHRLLAPDLPHDLGFLTSIYTREPYYKDESGKWSSDVRVPDDQFFTYNCKDAAVTLEIALAMMEDMRETNLLHYYESHMMPQYDVLLSMQERGIHVDTAKLGSVRQTLTMEVGELAGKLRDKVGWLPNTRSYIDMERMLLQFGVKPNRTTTGRPKVDEESLLMYANRQPAVQDIMLLCMEITQRRTLLSGFLEIVLDQQDFYHPSYDLSHAVSGRLSSSGAGVY